jgi:FixJ family two-component response regulator
MPEPFSWFMYIPAIGTNEDWLAVAHSWFVVAVLILMALVAGKAIKIRTAGGNGLPMVVAGPSWTRSKVLQAVKYGADDILITPAQSADIEEKIQANLQQKAA